MSLSHRLPCRSRRARLALLLMGVAACVDGPTGPLWLSELRLATQFASGNDPATLGVRVETTHVRATRRTGDPGVLVDTTLAYQADTDLSWVVTLLSSAESLSVEVELQGQGDTLYRGSDAFRLEADQIAPGPTHTVNLAYVGPPIVDHVVVSPDTATLTVAGATLQYAAEARDASDDTIGSVAFTWSSSDATVATIDPVSGLATAVANGTTVITAATGGKTGAARLTVALPPPPPPIDHIVVTPDTARLTALGAAQPFTAQAVDAAGTAIEGVTFAWTSSDSNVAAVGATSGVATALGNGTVTVSASAGGKTGQATLVVSQTIDRVVVMPASASLAALHATQQFTARALDANDSAVTGATFGWHSSAPTVAMVDSISGIATATGNGTTTVTAVAAGVSGAATLSVGIPIARIVVTPDTATLPALGATQQFAAEAQDASGNPIGGVAFAWTSSDTTVATVGATSGLATGGANGSTSITAAGGGTLGAATLTVAQRVVRVVVAPATATLTALGATRQFTAQAFDANGYPVAGTGFAWSSSAPAVARIDSASGLATAMGDGSAAIRAAVGAVSDSASLTVDVPIAAIEVTPEGATLEALGATQQFTAVARDAGGAPIPGATFIWSSSDTTVGTVDAVSGLATTVRNGVTSIRASAGGHSNTGALHVAQVVRRIDVTPTAVTLTALGATQQFAAEAFDANDYPVPGTTFVWSSSATTVATVDPASGLARAEGDGQANIQATAGGVAGTASVTVDVPIASIVVTPSSGTLAALGLTQQFTAVALDGGTSVIRGVSFAWTSSSTNVATIGPASGLATALADGETTIGASAGGVSGTATLTVKQVVDHIIVAPDTTSLAALDATAQFAAEARDATDHAIPAVSFTWTSSDPSVATVDVASGVATAVANGSTAIGASAGGVTGTGVLTVAQRIVSVVVTPPTDTLTSLPASGGSAAASGPALSIGIPPGHSTQQFTAQALDANGRPVAGAAFAWISSDPSVATVDASGLATAVGNGVTTITATGGGISDSAALTVRQHVASVTVSPVEATVVTGGTQQFTAEAQDANGNPIAGVVFSWISSDAGVATVDQTGLATGVAYGSALIKADAGGVVGIGYLSVLSGTQ